MDFALSALIFNIIVETIAYLFPNMLQNDISVTPLWNFLVIFFCLYPFVFIALVTFMHKQLFAYAYEMVFTSKKFLLAQPLCFIEEES